MHGFFNINKPSGPSSAQIIRDIKRKFNFKGKIGHTGTLDPLASGVLPVAVGEATKLISYLDESQKTYQATLCFGSATDTYDSTGIVTHQSNDAVKLTREVVAAALQTFSGASMQQAPLYSALKFKGKNLYEYARAGVEVAAPIRPVTITELKLLQLEGSSAVIEMTCTKGTYVRSLIHDLGLELGCYAHMTALKRTASGPFKLNISVDPAILREADLMDPMSFLAALPVLDIEDGGAIRLIKSGQLPYELQARLKSKPDSSYVIVSTGKILALGRLVAGQFSFARVLDY